MSASPIRLLPFIPSRGAPRLWMHRIQRIGAHLDLLMVGKEGKRP